MKNIRGVDITFALDDKLSVKEKGIMIMIIAAIPKWEWESKIDLSLIREKSKLSKSVFNEAIGQLMYRKYLSQESISEKLILSVK